MATFKTCVRKQRKDGFYPVYIRISQGTEVKYLKTGKLASQSAVSKQGEVNDPYIQKYCSDRIVEYVEMLNKVDTRNWSLAEIVVITKRPKTLPVDIEPVERKFEKKEQQLNTLLEQQGELIEIIKEQLK